MQKKVGNLAKKLVTGLGQVESTCPSAKKVWFVFTLYYFFVYLEVLGRAQSSKKQNKLNMILLMGRTRTGNSGPGPGPPEGGPDLKGQSQQIGRGPAWTDPWTLQDSEDESYRLTNDGNAFLCEIDVAHPTAKKVIELSRTQDKECVDGTSVIIILDAHLSTDFYLLSHLVYYHPNDRYITLNPIQQEISINNRWLDYFIHIVLDQSDLFVGVKHT